MPNIKSAKKRVRQSEKSRIRNRVVRSYIKNLRKKTIEVLNSKDVTKADALKAITEYQTKVDQTWSKGVFKRNKSSRLVSKMNALYYKNFLAKDNKQEA